MPWSDQQTNTLVMRGTWGKLGVSRCTDTPVGFSFHFPHFQTTPRWWCRCRLIRGPTLQNERPCFGAICDCGKTPPPSKSVFATRSYRSIHSSTPDSSTRLRQAGPKYRKAPRPRAAPPRKKEIKKRDQKRRSEGEPANLSRGAYPRVEQKSNSLKLLSRLVSRSTKVVLKPSFHLHSAIFILVW